MIKAASSRMSFLDLEEAHRALRSSRFVVIQAPYERSTSWGKGTRRGPIAIIEASKQVELFDEELFFEPCLSGIHTARPLVLSGLSPGAALKRVFDSVSDVFAASKVPVMLGGEHTITAGAVMAAKKAFPKASVLHIDAHADLRDSFEGDPNSHACVMRRVLDIAPVVQAGIRNISREEYDFASASGQLRRIYFARDPGASHEKRILRDLSDDVYISIDVDGLDPSVMPSTGTPEPGGFTWKGLLDLLRAVAEKKRIIGFDLMELSPIAGMHAPDFAAAKLVYKLMAYIVKGRGLRGRPLYGLHRVLKPLCRPLRPQKLDHVVYPGRFSPPS